MIPEDNFEVLEDYEDSEGEDYVIHHNMSKQMRGYLESNGASNLYFLNKKNLSLRNLILPIDVNNEKYFKRVNADKQYKMFDNFMNNLDKPIRMCIASSPSDLLAKQVALYVMYQTVLNHDAITNKKRGNYDKPTWFNVYNNFDNSLMKTTGLQYNPSLIILSNLTKNTSNNKLEKVRDILEKYDKIPVIIVVGGCNPITFFNTKLYYPLTNAVYLGRRKFAQ